MSDDEWPTLVAATIKQELAQLGLEIQEEHKGANPFLTSCTLRGQVPTGRQCEGWTSGFGAGDQWRTSAGAVRRLRNVGS